MVNCEILENGEEALLYRYDGKVSLKKGPKRVSIIFNYFNIQFNQNKHYSNNNIDMVD